MSAAERLQGASIRKVEPVFIADFIDALRDVTQPDGDHGDAPKVIAPPQGMERGAQAVIARIRASEQAEKFKDLNDKGDWEKYPKYESQSDADLALLDIIGWGCGYRPDQMERIFSASALGRRDKWQERPDYRQRSIRRALIKDKPAATAVPDTMLAPVDLRARWNTLPRPVQFIVDKWLPRGVTTMLGGHGDAGKTTSALVIGAHVAAGRHFAGLEVERAPVVFASLEDGADIVHLRLKRICEAYNLDAEAVLDYLTILDGSSGDATLMAEEKPGQVFLTPVYRRLRDACAGAGLIVIDNASDAYGGNENARREVRAFMRSLTEIAKENHAALLLLAHIDKAAAKHGSGESYSGSTAWHNSARSRLALVKDGDGILHLRHEKANLSAKAPARRFEFNPVGIPLPIRDGEDAAEEQDFTDLLPAFEAAAACGESVYANLNPGSHSAFKVLERFAEYPERYHGRGGRDLAAVGIQRLLQAGTLVREDYERSRRRWGTRLVIAEKCSTGLPEQVEDSDHAAGKISPKSAPHTPPNTPPRPAEQVAGASACSAGSAQTSGAPAEHQRSSGATKKGRKAK